MKFSEIIGQEVFGSLQKISEIEELGAKTA